MCIRDSINAEYMGQSNFLKKSKLQLIFLSLFIMQAMQAETAPHFQRISIESTNARVIDNRDPANPFNDIIFMCEHASNALPEGYSWSPNDAENFKDEHWAYDLGALDMAKTIAQDFGGVLVHSLVSRLLCDVNRPISSRTLFRKTGDGKVIELNQGPMNS
eukprot:TRINITY_DN2121_c0_g1_i2.p2 TRINITY_DN2121_c0_g1~~TRINITY_DN2121_c0_g1_i2.p2  ORF type:complete len:161 (+),score=24.02 TRINITY_DN2121_c0_g1_i2:67-549(+)